VIVLLPFGLSGLQACYSAVPNDGLVDAGPPPKSDASLDVAIEGFVGPGAPCSSAAGVLPSPDCHVPWAAGDAMACTAMGSKPCAIGSAATCGDSLCLPMADNSKSTTKNFRMEALHVAAPSVLAGPPPILQNSVVTSAVTPNDATQCGYPATQGLVGPGNGLFNWLLSVDTKNSVLTTGGAPFTADPYKDGFCFADGTIKGDGGASATVTPLVAPITIKGDTFTLAPLKGTLNIPIFTAPGTVPIVLPIGGVRMTATMSPDGNCIGDINPLWPAFAGSGPEVCQDNNLNACPKWFTNGALAGYITLAQADKVPIAALGGESLCSLLVGTTCTPADYTTKGDYCSTPAPAGGGSCKDSFWLSATFAANAVKLNPTGPAPCK
jgi:hypothetical protein